MKWLHLADLHLGKHHDTVDLLEDQRAVLEEILCLAKAEKVDGALISGDVYDRSLPPAEAVTVLDDFLTRLRDVCPVFLISGNHDSGERLAFAGSLLRREGVYIAGGLEQGMPAPVLLGDTDVYMLPFATPAQARYALGREDLHTMEEAVRALLHSRKQGRGRHSILLAHLFVTAQGVQPERSDSEIVPVGGQESVDASVFDGFDYVALGHLHGPQRVGRDTVRYAGSPLMYSFSEERQKKSVTVVEMDEETHVRLVPLHAGRKMRTLTGTLEALLHAPHGEQKDFVLARLTDATVQMEARSRLCEVYPNLLKVEYVAAQGAGERMQTARVEERTPEELFADFYRDKTGQVLTEKQQHVVQTLLGAAQKEG